MPRSAEIYPSDLTSRICNVLIDSTDCTCAEQHMRVGPEGDKPAPVTPPLLREAKEKNSREKRGLGDHTSDGDGDDDDDGIGDQRPNNSPGG